MVCDETPSDKKVHDSRDVLKRAMRLCLYKPLNPDWREAEVIRLQLCSCLGLTGFARCYDMLLRSVHTPLGGGTNESEIPPLKREVPPQKNTPYKFSVS